MFESFFISTSSPNQTTILSNIICLFDKKHIILSSTMDLLDKYDYYYSLIRLRKEKHIPLSKVKREEQMTHPYQQWDTRYGFDVLLANSLIKLIRGHRRVGKFVFALIVSQGKKIFRFNNGDSSLNYMISHPSIETMGKIV